MQFSLFDLDSILHALNFRSHHEDYDLIRRLNVEQENRNRELALSAEIHRRIDTIILDKEYYAVEVVCRQRDIEAVVRFYPVVDDERPSVIYEMVNSAIRECNPATWKVTVETQNFMNLKEKTE